MQTQAQQIKEACQKAFAKAKELYGLDLSMVGIRFDLKGRVAGMACARGSIYSGRTYYMRFNTDMMQREAFDHLLNDTVPHEVAHIVCFMNPTLGRNHDYGWKLVCRALGGGGDRCHKEDVVYGKGKTYEYTTTTGERVRLSEHKHRAVQMGQALTYRKRSFGQVNANCAHSIVGYQGRTLTAPVQARPANHPAVIPAVMRAPVAPSVRPTLAPVVRDLTPSFNRGESKASIARAIMLSGYRGGEGYDSIIQAIMKATGHDRNLARAYFKNNAPKLGIPATWG